MDRQRKSLSVTSQSLRMVRPALSTKPNPTIGRASWRESQIPEWLGKAKTKTVDKSVSLVAGGAVSCKQPGDAA